jgi:hypothetical protein
MSRRAARRTARAVTIAVVGIIVSAVLLAETPASAYDRPAELTRVASIFAKRDADVRCPSMAEWIGDPIWGTSPDAERAWGYTAMLSDYIVLHPALCAGALAVTDPTVPLWQRATGVLVLVHEAYHVRRWPGRWSEAKVECQAIRHFTAGARQFGASPELANELLPIALAAHWRMVTLYPVYRPRRCRLPVWKPPLSP